jgi:hypothetical protein
MTDQNSQFFAILTAVGEARQANADALGIAWKITHMGVGDADGTEPTPDRQQTALLNERRRAPLNQLKVDPGNTSIIIAEQVIPEDVGGWWIREIGLYDEAGDLVAIANCAPSFKPQLSQGSGRTQVVRMNLIVSSATNVELKIDPAVVLATRKYVDDELAKLDHKNSVRAATTANIALSGTQTIDGVALVAGDRVLVKNQASGAANGIYVVVGGAWSRAADADANIEVTPGMIVPVEQGTANADSVWQLVTDAPITLGTTALTFEAAAGPSGVSAGTYRSVTVDKRGRVIGGTNPTTMAGYAISEASQAEAETGTDNSKPTTPLRVVQILRAAAAKATEVLAGTLRVGTQTEVNAGTSDERIVTPKKLHWGFAISLAINGYIVFPTWLGGLIIQWGTAPMNSGSLQPITFSIGFPTEIFCVLCTTQDNIDATTITKPLIVQSRTLTGASLYIGEGGAINANYVAIGR